VRDYVPKDFHQLFDLVQSYAQTLELRGRRRARSNRVAEQSVEEPAEEAEEDPFGAKEAILGMFNQVLSRSIVVECAYEFRKLPIGKFVCVSKSLRAEGPDFRC
jgi:hypothetical protein